MNRLSRRSFIKSASLVVAAPLVVPAAVLGKEGRTAPNERFNMALIGCGIQGGGDMCIIMGFDQVRFVAVCDPIPAHRARCSRVLDNATEYVDYREALEHPGLDAILIGTPDHWHAAITIAAAKKGLDVFCEKPETLTVAEGRKMVDAVKKYGIVFSGGSQRVLDDYGDIPRLLWGGAIGEITEAYVPYGSPSQDCDLPAEDLPAGIDWDLWLGPAPWRPFHPNLIAGGFRPYREYSGGGMTDWGCHHFGAAMFAIQKHMTGPVEILPGGGDNKMLTYVFQDGTKVYHAYSGIAYVGTEGKIIAGRDGAALGTYHKPETRVEIPGYHWFNPWEHHGLYGDFVYCVKTRQQPFRNIEVAHRAATMCHLGNIVYWLERPVKWDPVKEKIIGDPEAARWLNRPKRSPWTDDVT